MRPHCPRCGGYNSASCSWCHGSLRLGGGRARATQIATLCEGMSDSDDRAILTAAAEENRELAERLEL